MEFVIKHNLTLLRDGCITLVQFTAILAKCHIYGRVRDSGGYIGYDYDMQKWIDIP